MRSFLWPPLSLAPLACALTSALALACGSGPTPQTPPPDGAGGATTGDESSADGAAASPSGAAGQPAAATACSSSAECGPGQLCTGEEGCDKAWTCQPSGPCTRDLRPYCGCDGTTFQASGSCPAKKYAKRGGC